MIGTEMLIESWPIDRPNDYARNARKITQAAVDKVAASLQEFDWFSANRVRQGRRDRSRHVRLRAAQAAQVDIRPSARRRKPDASAGESLSLDGQPCC